MASHDVFVQWTVMRVLSGGRMLLLTHNIWRCSRHSSFLFLLSFHPFICFGLDEWESFQLRLVGIIFVVFFSFSVRLELMLYEYKIIMQCVSWEKTGTVSFSPWDLIYLVRVRAYTRSMLCTLCLSNRIRNKWETKKRYSYWGRRSIFRFNGGIIWTHLHGIFN